MQPKFYNKFFVAKDECDFKNAAQAGVGRLNCLCKDPEFAAKMMKKYALGGKLILPSDLALDQENMKKFKNLGFELSIFVDLLDDDLTLSKIGFLKLPVTVLLYENLTRTGQISQKFAGKMPAQVLEDLGFLDRECSIVGGVYAEKDDLQILGDYGAEIVICPRAFAAKGATFANLKLLQKYPVKLGIGTFDYPEVDFDRELEFLRLTNCALFEDAFAVSKEELEKISQGENI